MGNAVTFATNDMSSSFSFYSKLGLRCTFGGPNASFTTFGSVGGPAYGDNSFHINLFFSDMYNPPAKDAWNGWGRAIFYVDDVDAMYAGAVRHALRPEHAPRD